MSYNIDFVNNKLYGADHINAVRTMIMTEGIIKKGDTDCLVTLMADGIHIDAGEALFNDGCRIEVCEAETIAHDGTDCYVYFDRNYYTEPKADKGTTLPENCIPLAKITGGEVKDLRSFATLKIPAMGCNRYMSKEFPIDFTRIAPGNVEVSLTFEDRTDINYMVIENEYGKKKTKLLFSFNEGYIFGYATDVKVSSTYVTNRVTFYDVGSNIAVKKQGNTVTFNIFSDRAHDLGIVKVTVL